LTDLALAYSNTTLFGLPGELSLTSMPGLIIRMIESLDVHDGHRVLGPSGARTKVLADEQAQQPIAALPPVPVPDRSLRRPLRSVSRGFCRRQNPA
jgi:hypothetical protein